MNRFRSAATSAIAGVATVAVTSGMLLAAAPAASAAEFSMPTPVVGFTAADQGSATSNTGTYVWLGLNESLQATIGTTLTGNEAAITFAEGQLANGYTLRWYSCPTRGAALTSCEVVDSRAVAPVGNAGGNAASAGVSLLIYTAKAEDAGRYLAYEVSQKISTIAGPLTRTAVSDRTKDVQIISKLGTTARPTWGINGVDAGEKASLLVFPWTLPTGSTFTGRALSVYACPNASQGQEATDGWSTSGCTTIPAGSITGGTVNANTASAFQVQTTESMAGKTLVAQVLLTSKTSNGTPTVFAVRSAGATLPGAAAPATPSASASATATAEAATPSTAVEVKPATAVVPKVKIIAVKSFTRGKPAAVAIELSGRGKGTVGTGTAIVELVKSAAPGAKTAQRLKTTAIKSMKGFNKQTLSKKLKKGDYYIRVIYTDSRSKVQAGALKKISVR